MCLDAIEAARLQARVSAVGAAMAALLACGDASIIVSDLYKFLIDTLACCVTTYLSCILMELVLMNMTRLASSISKANPVRKDRNTF